MPDDTAYLLSPRLSDAATLAASDAVGGAGGANVQIARPGLVWQSTSSTPYLTIDFGEAVTIDTIGLGWINAGESDTFRLRAAASAAAVTSAPVVDATETVWPALESPHSGVADLSLYGLVHRPYRLAAAQTLRYWRIDFTFTSYVQMGRLLMGERVQPALPVAFNWAPTGTEPIVETADMGGEEVARPRGVKRGVRMEWGRLTSREALGGMYALLLERGSSGDMMAVVDPGQTEADCPQYANPMAHCYIGRKKESFELVNTFYNNHTLVVAVQELSPVVMA
jgi:hypothetical protein